MKVPITKVLDEIGKVTIIDIRKTEDCVGKGMIPSAINIYKEELLKNPSLYLNKEQKYYIYCNGGNSATVVAGVLNGLGYCVASIDGGHRSYLEINQK